jgi:Mrp family chromosome partitioning ATPase
MSRNFEMLQQAEQSRNLFRSAVVATPISTPQVAPAQTEPQPRQTEKPDTDERPAQSSFSDLEKAAAAPSGLASRSWISRLRTILHRATGGSVEATSNRGNIDFKNMALQEEIKLVERVFLGPDTGLNRMILFSGVDKAEGGARVCARTAHALASRTHGSVCMIDLDQSSRSLQRHLGIGNSPGLSEALLQSDSIRHYAQPLTLNNLWMIPCGGAADHPQVMRNSERIKIRFEELRRQFDFVLLNAPSMSMTVHLTQLAKLADGVIFVIEANSTRRETTRRLKESLQEIQARVLGVVLNDRSFPIPESVYRKL